MVHVSSLGDFLDLPAFLRSTDQLLFYICPQKHWSNSCLVGLVLKNQKKKECQPLTSDELRILEIIQKNNKQYITINFNHCLLVAFLQCFKPMQVKSMKIKKIVVIIIYMLRFFFNFIIILPIRKVSPIYTELNEEDSNCVTQLHSNSQPSARGLCHNVKLITMYILQRRIFNERFQKTV